MPPGEAIYSLDEEERYEKYLQKVIPSNNELFKIMRERMEDCLSFYEIMNYYIILV